MSGQLCDEAFDRWFCYTCTLERASSHNWKPNVVMMPNLSSRVGPYFAMTTTCGAASDEKVGICHASVMVPTLSSLVGLQFAMNGHQFSDRERVLMGCYHHDAELFTWHMQPLVAIAFTFVMENIFVVHHEELCGIVIWCIKTHWGRVTHICVGKLTIIGSDNGLSPGRHQAGILTNPGILLTGPLGRNFNEILIEIQTFSFKKIHLNMSAK